MFNRLSMKAMVLVLALPLLSGCWEARMAGAAAGMVGGANLAKLGTDKIADAFFPMRHEEDRRDFAGLTKERMALENERLRMENESLKSGKPLPHDPDYDY